MTELQASLRALQARLEELGDPRRSGGASRNTELFFEDGERDTPLVIVHHIRKTAGTTLRAVMSENFADAVRLHIPGLGYKKGVDTSRDVLLDANRRLWELLSVTERRALRCVASHEANFIQPFADRPTLVVSLVRQPVDRVISRYYFANRSSSQDKMAKRKANAEGGRGRGLSRVLRQRSLEDVFRLGGKKPAEISNDLRWLSLFNGQARSLLEPYHDTTALAPTAGPSPDADLWRERLFTLMGSDHLVGVSERFDEFVGLLCDRLGWQPVPVSRMKVNASRPARESLPTGLVDLIAEYNWLDGELYDRQLSAQMSAARKISGRTSG
jgi:hypothetical protein